MYTIPFVFMLASIFVLQSTTIVSFKKNSHWSDKKKYNITIFAYALLFVAAVIFGILAKPLSG